MRAALDATAAFVFPTEKGVKSMSTGNSTLASSIVMRTKPSKTLPTINGHAYTSDSAGKVTHSTTANTSAFDNGVPTDYVALLAEGCDHVYSGPSSPLARV